MLACYLYKLKLSGAFNNRQLLLVAQYLEQKQQLPNQLADLLAIAEIAPQKRAQVQRQLKDPLLSQKVAFNNDVGHFLTILDDAYPNRLREIYDPPAVLFYQGDLTLLQRSCLGVVGARFATTYGTAALKHVLKELDTVTIISGLAQGIDRTAHQIALATKLATVAVIATGLDSCYPSQNNALQNTIQQKGLLLSEYPAGTLPRRFHFPIRNRIIAGLSHALLVVEAKQKSGSLITANLALEYNRNVLAIPGSLFAPTSQGTNALIKAGAAVVTSPDDLRPNLTYYP
ncbi:Rossmann fold nucleotide-binding protein for DNA uptake [Agrilactobacillus composti DSM 18527 = JCM 14202]|uniref:Rossmann fold nucleotide-binding protein for DNA uptake n=1 Tax=Agrilactobacillus composti DSM 18527 = JCM 14202 TaxID=1423734 RepID=X0PNJ6_9LACO|nr:DNA-processing protein DprA [Agrilactobacillus composti]KRM36536.1 Rossmann fold nucleotide-binding protein for DNA uptake [Agrilactobacillus composti DSM 18527 = JCM 14202]GAF39152.1 Rossmann fold nucleotide-binding protein Smf [Agrilactobacillus composti DSM 18527 = JCM 14202]